MSNEIHDEEERDLIDAADLDPRTTPMFQTAPERIGLAIGDELEDWMSEFDDCDEVSWYSGEPPVQVSIGYVRADLYDELVESLRDLLAEYDAEIDSEWSGTSSHEAMRAKANPARAILAKASQKEGR